MIIQSKFHDYYDGAGMMVDKTIVYRREEKTSFEHLGIMYQGPEFASNAFGKGFDAEFDYYVFGFCGRIIPCIKVSVHSHVWSVGKPKDDFKGHKYVYSAEQLQKVCDVNNPDVLKWFSQADSLSDSSWMKDQFLERKIPVFVCSLDYYHGYVTRFVANPCLKAYEFFKVEHPTSAYQSIMFFLSNDLANVKEVDVVMTDKVMAASKGFGHKYAFKKEPTKKR